MFVTALHWERKSRQCWKHYWTSSCQNLRTLDMVVLYIQKWLSHFLRFSYGAQWSIIISKYYVPNIKLQWYFIVGHRMWTLAVFANLDLFMIYMEILYLSKQFTDVKTSIRGWLVFTTWIPLSIRRHPSRSSTRNYTKNSVQTFLSLRLFSWFTRLCYCPYWKRT